MPAAFARPAQQVEQGSFACIVQAPSAPVPLCRDDGHCHSIDVPRMPCGHEVMVTLPISRKHTSFFFFFFFFSDSIDLHEL